MMHIGNSRKFDVWIIALLVLLNASYLLAELVFNATLLNTASSIDNDTDVLHHAELFGRNVSGAGFSLLVLGILRWLNFGLRTQIQRIGGALFVLLCIAPFALDIRNYAPLALTSGLFGGYALYHAWKGDKYVQAAIGTIVFAWIAMFCGQKILIEHFLIAPSTPEARLNAQYMGLLKVGISKNYLNLDGTPTFENGITTPEEKTFVALLGSLAMRTTAFLEQIKAKEEPILIYLQESISQQVLAKRYAEYIAQGKEFDRQWRLYDDASVEYEKALSNAGNAAIGAYADTLNRVRQGYIVYQEEERKFLKAVNLQAEGAASKLQAFDRSRHNCNNYQPCIDNHNRRYDAEMQATFGKQVLWTFWCEDAESFQGDIATLAKDITTMFWTGRKNGTACDLSAGKVGKRLVVLKEEQFKSAIGYPLGIKSKSEFMSHPATAARVRVDAKQQGINIPSSWKIDDSATFIAATKNKIVTVAKQKWNSKVTDLAGGYVEPRLNYSQFVHHPLVQKKIKLAMKDDYVPNMTFEYSEKEFKQRIIEPAAGRAIKAKIDGLRSALTEFADGHQREEEGKQYLRAVLIPPITLFLSLLVAMITLSKGLVALLIWLIPDHYKEHYGARIKLALWSCVIASILTSPFLIPNKFSESRAFRYFTSQTITTYPLSTALCKWTIRMQPAMYGVGESLRLNIEAQFVKLKRLI